MPKVLIRNFITPQEAAQIYHSQKYDSVIPKIVSEIQKVFKVQIPCLSTIPHRITFSQKTSHGWHFDGCHPDFVGEPGKFTKLQDPDLPRVYQSELVDNHMGWCRFGASLLLSPPDSYEGGEFQYYDRQGKITSIKDEHYCSLVIHTGHKTNQPELHRVLPFKAKTHKRTTLLVFV